MSDIAIIGLDGLAPRDVDEFSFPGEWETLDIETTAHTHASWNAIFTGRERDGVYNFWKLPDNAESLSGPMAQHSSERWTYDELRTDDYLWERFDVEVVSAPVVLPTHSTLGDEAPGVELTWSTSAEEIAASIPRLTELTLAHETVITVFPFPDKMHHLVDNREKAYAAANRHAQMADLRDALAQLTDAFDDWVVLSDHARPGPAERIPHGDLTVAAHHTPGVIRSNCIETSGLTNVSVYERLAALLADN